jgi:hypothetical protein
VSVMRKRILSAFLAPASILAILVAACASGGKKDTGMGIRTLDCTVVEREQSAPGSSGTSRSYATTGDYFMVFEAKEGAATSRYRLQVTRTQWFRFPEGSRVRITLNNNILTDIRSIE